jgi:transcriptional regulator of acetoin/glycerol metabolism
MLVSEGDPAALEGLAEINFRPGGHWAEAVVGTNGPGTAIAAGRPVHIIGAEHFCAGWQRWHCAAVPIRHPTTGEIIGVLDISGFREVAHPHTYNLALALVVAIQQALTTRELQRQCLAMAQLGDLARRFPGDHVVAVDRLGRILPGTSGLAPGHGESLAELSRIVPSLLTQPDRGRLSCELPLDRAAGGDRAIWFPVLDAGRVIGGCVLLGRQPPPRGATRGDARVRPSDAGTRYRFSDLIGESPALLRARSQATAAARTELPVLLLGESGTGKELFAQAIHAASDRGHGPFVAVNCAALPRELIESELFGYAAGAFTGARKEGRAGKFEAARGGTIFLDEIAELPPPAQAALLRVLAEGEITRIGSTRAAAVDVRVIAATNRRPETAIAEGSLRSDLFHRLNVLPIELPTLRERRSDVGLLAERFFARTALELGRADLGIEPEVLEALEAYDWPGNVRELLNLTRRLVANAGSRVRVSDLPPAMRAAHFRRTTAGPADDADRLPSPTPEADLVRAVTTSRTMAEAAASLGITRSTLYRRMERCGLRRRRVLDRD